MKNPAVYMDVFLTDERRHQLFNNNLNGFIKNGWDVFLVSNKIHHFDAFSSVKYFHYDTTNRILPDRYKYHLPDSIYYNFNLHDGVSQYNFNGYEPIHGFSNWTVFYNLRHIAGILKAKGYTHFVTCEYDVNLQSYDLMNTIFKDFGTTPESMNCMIQKGFEGFNVMVDIYLMNVDTILNAIPVMETEEDYMNFMRVLHPRNDGIVVSPVYEQLFYRLLIDTTNGPKVHYIDNNVFNTVVNRSTRTVSAGGVSRQRMSHANMIMCPVNNNESFLLYHWNRSTSNPILVEYTADGVSQLLKIDANCWNLINCRGVKHISVTTSELLSANHSPFEFDLVNQNYNFTFTKTN